MFTRVEPHTDKNKVGELQDNLRVGGWRWR